MILIIMLMCACKNAFPLIFFLKMFTSCSCACGYAMEMRAFVIVSSFVEGFIICVRSRRHHKLPYPKINFQYVCAFDERVCYIFVCIFQLIWHKAGSNCNIERENIFKIYFIINLINYDGENPIF